MANSTKKEIQLITGQMDLMKDKFLSAMPSQLNFDRFKAVLASAMTSNPALAECERVSLIQSMFTAATLGLEPTGILGQAYLVPFGTGKGRPKAAQLIIGYRGYITIARNSGEISKISAREVREGDEFRYALGTDEYIHHIPSKKRDGEITHFYATCKFKDGSVQFEVMTVDEVNAIRDQVANYKFSKDKSSTVWGQHYAEMGKKTAIRRLSKYLPFSITKLHQAAALDGLQESGKRSFVNYDDDVDYVDYNEIKTTSEQAEEGTKNAMQELVEELDAEDIKRQAEMEAAQKAFEENPDYGDEFNPETGELM